MCFVPIPLTLTLTKKQKHWESFVSKYEIAFTGRTLQKCEIHPATAGTFNKQSAPHAPLGLNPHLLVGLHLLPVLLQTTNFEIDYTTPGQDSHTLLEKNLHGAAGWVDVEVHPQHRLSPDTSLFHVFLRDVREPESAEVLHQSPPWSVEQIRVAFDDALVSLRTDHHHFRDRRKMCKAGREFIRSVWKPMVDILKLQELAHVLGLLSGERFTNSSYFCPGGSFGRGLRPKLVPFLETSGHLHMANSKTHRKKIYVRELPKNFIRTTIIPNFDEVAMVLDVEVGIPRARRLRRQMRCLTDTTLSMATS